MRVLYDAVPLLLRSAGVKNYHHSLLSHLGPIFSPHQLELFPYLDDLTANANERSNYSTLGTYARLGAVLASNYLHLPLAQAAAARADVFHITPHFWRPPPSAALTSMVHDPTPLTMPRCHSATNIRYFEGFVERMLPRLSGLIVPSHAVKQDLASLFGTQPEKIHVVYHGVDEDFFDASGAQRQTARRTYDLPDSFVLFVGSLEPRKNLVRLADAHSRLPARLRERHPLVVVGAAGWRNEEIHQALRRNRHARVVGFVSRELLPAVFASATVFAFPSLYEGFGMPLLEAMAAGTPVLTSNVSAMPEVIGDCGTIVDPYDVEALTEALRETLEDPHGAGETASRARQRARQFTWERCAQQTKEFFERVADVRP